MLSNATGSGRGLYQIVEPHVSADIEAEAKAMIDDYIDEMPKMQEFDPEQLR